MSLAGVLDALTDELPAGSFAIIGAVARNAWAPPRATTDLDLVVLATHETLAAAESTLARLGYVCVRRSQTERSDALPDLLIFRAEDPELRQVDLLVAKTSFEDEALRRATPVKVGARDVPVVTPEDLVVYKLLAGRPRDWEDVRVVLRTRNRAGTPLEWAYVERWCAFWGVADRLEKLRAEELG